MEDVEELERSVTTVHFSITGEFVTERARELWFDGWPSKALEVLECVMFEGKPISLDLQRDLLSGKKRFEGMNDLSLVDDDWQPPDGYPSFLDGIARGDHFAELLDLREMEACYQLGLAFDDAGNHIGMRRKEAVAEKMGEEWVNERWNEMAVDRAVNRTVGSRYEGLGSAPKKPVERKSEISPEDLLLHHMKVRMELAGFDSSQMATPEQVMNRGYDKDPVLCQDMSSTSGWLLPNGSYYGCGPMEHVGLAANLLPDDFGGDPEREAERLGWIKLVKSITGFHCIGSKKPTKKQLTKLWDYAQVHGRDYEEMIESVGR